RRGSAALRRQGRPARHRRGRGAAPSVRRRCSGQAKRAWLDLAPMTHLESQEARMTDTTAPVLGEATVQELREGVRGEVLGRQDPGYAEACRVWNAAHDGRRPALVVRCAGAADVVA